MPRPIAVSGALVLTLAAAFAAPVRAQDPTYYNDVRPILVENCLGCHDGKGAAWSMRDPEEAFERRRKIVQAIMRRHMPPWLAKGGHQEYVGNPMLEEYVLKVVQKWRDGDYKKGDPKPDPVVTASAAGGHGAAHSGAFSPHVSLPINPGSSYLPTPDRVDDYRCFVVDWTGKEPSFITGFRAVPGNRKLSHHVVIYEVLPEMAARFRELQDAEEGDGYRCFGGALPDRLGRKADRAAYEAKYPDGVRELNRKNFWLAHWAPGMDGHVFPEGTGIPVNPGSAFVVQVHYYNKEAPGERDAGSTLDFMIASEVERPAYHAVVTENDWFDGKSSGTMVVPAGDSASVRTSMGLRDILGEAASITGVKRDDIEALEVHSVNLHMHGIGHSGTVALERTGAAPDTLLRIPRWDLGWQRDFAFVTPKVFTPEQATDARITLQCTFQNPHQYIVYGGLGSDDEMCMNFSYVAVRRKNPVKAASAVP